VLNNSFIFLNSFIILFLPFILFCLLSSSELFSCKSSSNLTSYFLFFECLYDIKINPDRVARIVAEKVFSIFQDEMYEYNPKLVETKSSVVGYHLYMPINMRFYGNNLSVVNQIINDIHYCLFRTHPACYIFRAPESIIDPLYYLDIYVSNFSATNHSYLSTIMFQGIDAMSEYTRSIMIRMANHFTNNGTRPYHVNPFSVNPTSTIPDPNAAKESDKPNNLRYADWYSNLFGDEVVRRYVVDKPLIKI
jgi:hypothetical protein